MPLRLPIVWLALGLVCLLGCTMPARTAVVAPAISGSIDVTDDGAVVALRVLHRESANLHLVREVPLRDGAFAFEPAELVVAGREYSKVYRAFLHLKDGSADRVLWRAEFSRRELAGPVRLDCEVDRPVRHGQPCRVRGAKDHSWLVSAGRERFEALCARCHEPESGQAPDLRDLASRHEGDFDHDAVAEWIEGRALPEAHGSRSMPIWGEVLSQRYEHIVEGEALIGADLDAILAYVESLQTR